MPAAEKHRQQVEILRETLLTEHAMQQIMQSTNLVGLGSGYRPRLPKLLGPAGSSRRIMLRRSVDSPQRLLHASNWRLRKVARKTRSVLIRTRRAALGQDVHVPKMTFSDSDRRKRNRLAAEYRELAFDRVEELRNIHAGKRCFIIGNGPSLKDADLTVLADETVFVTNWFANHESVSGISPDYYCICSHELFGGWGNAVPEFNADLRHRIEQMPETTMVLPYRFMPHIESGGLFTKHDRRYLLFDRPKMGIDEAQTIELDLSKPLHDGYTVILTFCLPLAKWMGFTEIYLLGVDSNYGISKPDDPKQYFYDSKLHTSSTSKFESLDRIWAPGGPVFQNYQIVKDVFFADGVTITNLTPGGRLEVFERSTLEAVMGVGSE